jgi:DNA-binding MarR family transcriptional regulator
MSTAVDLVDNDAYTGIVGYSLHWQPCGMAKQIPLDEVADCTCLRIRKVTRRITQIYDQLLESSGITTAQFSLLAHIMGANGVSIGKLADALVMDPTTLTRNLQPLIAKHYLTVVLDADDRRRRAISLTDDGRAALRAAYPLWRQAQLRLALYLGNEEMARLNGLLDRSLDRLADI